MKKNLDDGKFTQQHTWQIKNGGNSTINPQDLCFL